MKKLFTPVIKYGIKKAKKSRFVQSLFEAPFELDKFEKIGEFIDSDGNKHAVLSGLRTKIKPGWESMLKTKSLKVNAADLSKLKDNATIAVHNILPILATYGKSIKGSDILEIGCNTGAASYVLGDLGANSVIGSEFTGYKVQSIETTDENEANRLVEVSGELLQTRKDLGALYKDISKVKFIEDDICNSGLEKESFDIIFSWEVLEHLSDPTGAFKAMQGLLKKDGIIFHLYNPFFCLTGGHSLCTLDFLWGHARISDTDFLKYMDEFRPVEKEMAYSFFKQGLNRMTLADLEKDLTESNFDILTILPYTKEQHVRMADYDTLTQSQKLYPNLVLLDMVAPRVLVVAKKK